MHAFKANLFFWFFYVVSYALSLIQLFFKCWVLAKRITENVWASFECMWECSQLTMCFKFLYYIIMYKSNSNENVQFFFMGIVRRHFLIVHAMHHKYWVLQKRVWGQSSPLQSTKQEFEETQKWLHFCIANKKTVASVQSNVIVTFVLWDCVFLWTFGFHLKKKNTWCKIMFLATSVDPMIGTRSMTMYFDLKIKYRKTKENISLLWLADL